MQRPRMHINCSDFHMQHPCMHISLTDHLNSDTLESIDMNGEREQRNQLQFQGHIVTELKDGEPAVISIGPDEHTNLRWTETMAEDYARTQSVNARMVDHVEESGMVAPLPDDPTPGRGRAPIYYEPTGYVEVAPGARIGRLEESALDKDAKFVTGEQFDKFASNFKREDGKYVAMTAYGAVPVPQELLKDVPDKFVSQPIIKEKDTFVLKKTKHERIIEKNYTQHEHHFVEVVRKGEVEKFVPAGEVKVIKVPKYIYKPVISNIVIPVPMGIRCVQDTVDMALQMPPRLVPTSYPMIIERKIECTKPVVQEKIIEIPKVVKKAVPKMVTKEIPFIVPKYVEKIVEVPFRPGMQLPQPTGSLLRDIPDMPEGVFQGDSNHPVNFANPNQQQHALSPSYAGSNNAKESVDLRQEDGARSVGYNATHWESGQSSSGQHLLAKGAEGGRAHAGIPGGATRETDYQASRSQARPPRVEGNALIFDSSHSKGPQTVYIPPGVKEIKLPYEAKIDVSVVQMNDTTGARSMIQDAQPIYRDEFGNRVQITPRRPWNTHMNQDREAPRPIPKKFMENNQEHAAPRDERFEDANITSTSQSSKPHVRGCRGLCRACCEGTEKVGDSAVEDVKEAISGNTNTIVVHDTPGMGNIEYSKIKGKPVVLTQEGIRSLPRSGSWLNCGKDPVTDMFPPMAKDVPVPIHPITGLADLEELKRIQDDYWSKLNPSVADRLNKQV